MLPYQNARQIWNQKIKTKNPCYVLPIAIRYGKESEKCQITIWFYFLHIH